MKFIEIWTYKIPQYSKTNQLEWAFIFEDDVDFNDPSKISLPNYIASLKEMMNNFQVQKYGFFIWAFVDQTLIMIVNH